MSKRIGRIQSSGDTPLHVLYTQGIAWEGIRAHYWSQRGDAQRMMDATARAAHYQAAWESLPEMSHRYSAPRR